MLTLFARPRPRPCADRRTNTHGHVPAVMTSTLSCPPAEQNFDAGEQAEHSTRRHDDGACRSDHPTRLALIHTRYLPLNVAATLQRPHGSSRRARRFIAPRRPGVVVAGACLMLSGLLVLALGAQLIAAAPPASSPVPPSTRSSMAPSLATYPGPIPPPQQTAPLSPPMSPPFAPPAAPPVTTPVVNMIHRLPPSPTAPRSTHAHASPPPWFPAPALPSSPPPPPPPAPDLVIAPVAGALMSSFSGPDHAPSNCIDGTILTSCLSAWAGDGQPRNWLTLDLGIATRVVRIDVYVRQPCEHTHHRCTEPPAGPFMHAPPLNTIYLPPLCPSFLRDCVCASRATVAGLCRGSAKFCAHRGVGGQPYRGAIRWSK